MMEERVVTSPEPAAIVLKRRRGHRRIPEPWMAFDIRLFSLVNIAPSSRKSIMKTLPGDLWKIWWRGRFGIYRMWVRASSECKGQQ